MAKTIRELIPAATAMERDSFEEISRSSEEPRRSDFNSKSLTVILMTLEVVPDKERRDEFRVLSIKTPAVLLKELMRYERKSDPHFPVTLIHENRITKITCDIQGEEATGTVSFRVPEGYAGKVQYTAGQHKGHWQIQEFRLPAHGIRIIRAENDQWKEAPQNVGRAGTGKDSQPIKVAATSAPGFGAITGRIVIAGTDKERIPKPKVLFKVSFR